MSKKSLFSKQPTLNIDKIKSNIFTYGQQGNLEAWDLLNQYKEYYTPTNLHFLYNELQNQFYKKRDENPVYLEKTIEVCKADLELLLNKLLQLAQSAKLPCIDRLIAIYEKKKDYQKAIDICQTAVDNFFHGDYYIKLQKLNYKLYPETKPKDKIINVIDVNVITEKEQLLINTLNNELTNRGYKEATFQLLLTGEIDFAINSKVDPTFNLHFKIKLRNKSPEYLTFALNTEIFRWINTIDEQDKLFAKFVKNK